MSALNDFGRVADAVLANKNAQRENDRIASANLQAQKLGSDASMQTQKIGSEEKMQGQRIDATTALAGLNHTNDMSKLAEADKFRASEQSRATGSAALLAGGNEAVAANMINNQAGFPADPKGLNIPLKNNQLDQYQFITQDAPVGSNLPATIFAGNKGSGQVSPVDTAAAALSGQQTGQPAAPRAFGNRLEGQQQQQPAAPTGGPTSQAATAFDTIYKDTPQRLQEDAAFAVSQIGTVHKTPEEQKSYLLAMRQSNPTLFNKVYQSLQR